MIKASIVAVTGLGAIAISYIYAQSFITLLATAMVTLGSWSYAAYIAVMSLVALSAFPYVVIGLAATFVCYQIMSQATKWYYRGKEHKKETGDVTATSSNYSYLKYKIAIVSVLLGLVAAIICKLFFAAIVLSGIGFMPLSLAVATNIASVAAICAAAFLILKYLVAIPDLAAAIIVLLGAALCAVAVLGSANFIPALLAAVTSFAIINAIATGISTILAAAVLPTVLAYLAIGGISAGTTKLFLDLVSWVFSPSKISNVEVLDIDHASSADAVRARTIDPNVDSTSEATGSAQRTAVPITDVIPEELPSLESVQKAAELGREVTRLKRDFGLSTNDAIKFLSDKEANKSQSSPGQPR